MQDIDRVFKALTALRPNSFLDLLFGSERKIVLREVADPQINLPELRGDKAFVIEENGKTFNVILEAMLRPAAEDLPTFELKARGMQYLTKRPTLVVVVYLEKGGYASFQDRFEVRCGAFINRIELAKILLWEHESRIASGELKELAPFLSLLRDQPGVEIIDTQIALIRQVPDQILQNDLTALAAIVDTRVFGLSVVLEKFKTEEKMIKESSIVEEWMKEWQQEGMQEGMQKGMHEGLAEGKLALLQNILAKKFGGLTADLADKLHQLKLAELDRLGPALLDFNSLDDLKNWLGSAASGGGQNP